MTDTNLEEAGHSTEEGKLLIKAIGDAVEGRAPLKVVTGTQTTSSLSFELKPGAIVAHPNSTVIFVCG